MTDHQPDGPTTAPPARPRVSVLYPPGPDGLPDRSVLGRPASPDTLRDLALDKLVDQLATGLAPELREVATTPLTSVAAVRYRHEVFIDLREADLNGAVRRFGQGMHEFAARRARRRGAHYTQEARLWTAHATATYVRTIEALAAELAPAAGRREATSEALTGFAAFVVAYATSPGFTALREHAARVEQGLTELRFAVWARGGKVTVARAGVEPDLEQQVLATFERFRQSDVATKGQAPEAGNGLDHVQASILDQIALAFPELFADLAALAATSASAVPDPTIGAVADELHFYLAFLDLLAPAEAAGLPTCLPEVVAERGELAATDAWDLPLGLGLVADGRPVVTNDLDLHGQERVIVVSGPNQGGKTTTARTFGQLHHLASVGVPVTGRRVHLALADQVLTVFEREETAAQLGGRLGEELARVHHVLDVLTPRSVVVLNEVFSSTALADADFLARRVLERLIEASVPTLLVTFIDELSRLGPATVSMVSVVDPDDPTVRTFKVERRFADGRAYAAALAARYGLGRDDLARRLAR